MKPRKDSKIPEYEMKTSKESHLRISKRQRERQEKEIQRKKEEAAAKKFAGKLAH